MAKLQILSESDAPILHDLSDEKTTVGRVADNDVQIEDASVSSHHAEFFMRGEVLCVRDLNSTNGTTVNGTQVKEQSLRPGDLIQFGSVDALLVDETPGSGIRPLPESASASREAANTSERPANFKNSSPYPKAREGRDVFRVIAFVVAALAFAVFVVCLFFVFDGMRLPSFPEP